MSGKGMKALLKELGEEVGRRIQRPADPEIVMAEFCSVMSERKGRPVDLAFREFPAALPVSGLRLVMSDRSLIVIAAGMNPRAQLLIFGHELYHEEYNHCSHALPGVGAAARAVDASASGNAIRHAAELIIDSAKVPEEALIAVAARSESTEADERDAETFGVYFGTEIRTWVTGRYAQPRVSAETVEGRLALSLSHRGGRLL
jgi:hypothetical protein